MPRVCFTPAGAERENSFVSSTPVEATDEPRVSRRSNTLPVSNMFWTDVWSTLGPTPSFYDRVCHDEYAGWAAGIRSLVAHIWTLSSQVLYPLSYGRG